ncbi:MAG: efflux RND transporter periplasmic adaptor subunit [Candidatus Abyssubacteria bacterium]
MGLIVAVLLSAVLFGACADDGEKVANASQSKPAYVVTVKAAPVVREGIRSTIHAVGTVNAIKQAKISAKVPGKVERIFVSEGDKVRAGQVLLELEKTDFELAVRQAEAALSMAEANYSKASLDWTRSQELLERGIASQQQYDLARSAYEIAQASVKQAEADLGLAQNQLANATVTTLFAGEVTHKYVDIGERIQPGQPLFEVADITPVEIEVGIGDKRFCDIKLGQSADIKIDGYPDREFKGVVKKIQPAIDPFTRTFKVTLGVENPEELLKPGMFARTVIEVDYHPDALVIPKSALLEEEGEYLAVVVNDNKAHRVGIQPGFIEGEKVEILSGLAEGDLVVMEGAYGLGEGALVNVAEE